MSSQPGAIAGSVGLVTPQTYRYGEPFELRSGATLPGFDLRYETYGQLNAAGTNALLICHALSGHHHAAGRHHEDDPKPGWWDNCIGPGKPLDTNQFFIVSSNNLGGCHGSTGPNQINPDNGAPYGADFPIVTVPDWVRSQALLADHLGIHRWAAVVGGSLGGMQALQWAIDYPQRVAHAVVIAAASRLSAQNIAFNEIARHAILTDADFQDGEYASRGSNPDHGLALARMIGHVTYLSAAGMGDRFGRSTRTGDPAEGGDVQFEVESYLQYQGRNFAKAFDANTYIRMTRALDYFDPAADHGDDLVKALRLPDSSSEAATRFLVLSFSTDWRFSPARSRELVDTLVAAKRDVVYGEIDSPHGHDSFLLPIPRYFQLLGGYLDRVAHSLSGASSS